MKIELKTPISYYGGKQNMAAMIVPMIPEHVLYAEPFVGGAAIFFAKTKSKVEVINDTNREAVNFYRQVQNNFVSLEKEIQITLHSRDLHRKASVIYNNPDMFDDIKRAWAFWTLSAQCFGSIIDGSFGYDKKKGATSKKIDNKRKSFTEEFAVRLQNVQIECADALYVIRSRDTKDSFFYCDPPYYNANMGHYDGYTKQDFDNLLDALSKIEGKFLLSSYPSDLLTEYTKKFGWYHKETEMTVSVAKVGNTKPKRKIEVLTANYDLNNM